MLVCVFVCLMMLNATFNTVSVKSLLSVLLVEETGGPDENHRLVASHANFMLQCIIDKIICGVCLSLSFIQLCIVVLKLK
jgi:hypothetical protein